MNRFDFEDLRRRVYRDTERGVILGVCAGVAEWLGLSPWLIRAAALTLCWFFPIPVVVAYIVAAMLMRERPLRYYGDGDERTFWQSHGRRS